MPIRTGHNKSLYRPQAWYVAPNSPREQCEIAQSSRVQDRLDLAEWEYLTRQAIERDEAGGMPARPGRAMSDTRPKPALTGGCVPRESSQPDVLLEAAFHSLLSNMRPLCVHIHSI